MASAPLLCVRSTSDCQELARAGITNTLPRPGAGEQGRAAIGRRMARRQIRMFAESLPSLPGGCAGGLPRPLSGLQVEEFGGEVVGLVVVKCTRLLVLVQGGARQLLCSMVVVPPAAALAVLVQPGGCGGGDGGPGRA